MKLTTTFTILNKTTDFILWYTRNKLSCDEVTYSGKLFLSRHSVNMLIHRDASRKLHAYIYVFVFWLKLVFLEYLEKDKSKQNSPCVIYYVRHPLSTNMIRVHRVVGPGATKISCFIFFVVFIFCITLFPALHMPHFSCDRAENLHTHAQWP